MNLLARILTPKTVVHAHCDLPCGVYDPAQARIEAESVKAIIEKYQANEDPAFRTRALIIKEQRADLVKHHLWVLWTDYFKPTHLETLPRSCTRCSGTPPSWPARPVRRASRTRPLPSNSSTRSPRSTPSSGRRRRPSPRR